MIILFIPSLVAIMVIAPMFIADNLNTSKGWANGCADSLPTLPAYTGEYEFMQRAPNN
jgi:hypothetical protein